MFLDRVKGAFFRELICHPIALWSPLLIAHAYSIFLVPHQAARVVVTWLNKAKEAEEKRARAAAEPLALDGGGDNDEISEEDDDDQDEFVYDIQVCNSRSNCCGYCCCFSYDAVSPSRVLVKQHSLPPGITDRCGSTVNSGGIPCRI